MNETGPEKISDLNRFGRNETLTVNDEDLGASSRHAGHAHEVDVVLCKGDGGLVPLGVRARGGGLSEFSIRREVWCLHVGPWDRGVCGGFKQRHVERPEIALGVGVCQKKKKLAAA